MYDIFEKKNVRYMGLVTMYDIVGVQPIYVRSWYKGSGIDAYSKSITCEIYIYILLNLPILKLPHHFWPTKFDV